MKSWWKIQSVRIDALNLRERAFLFITVLVVCMALVEFAVLSPAQTQQRQVAQRFKTQDADLRKLQDEFEILSKGVDAGPGKAMRAELATVKARLAEVNQAIGKVPTAAIDGTPLSEVLVHFLRKHEGLTLVKTVTLGAPAASPSAVASAMALVSGAPVVRQGLELTVAGPYSELVRYVQTLEHSLPALRWGTMRLVSDKQPPQLTLQVYLSGAPR